MVLSASFRWNSEAQHLCINNSHIKDDWPKKRSALDNYASHFYRTLLSERCLCPWLIISSIHLLHVSTNFLETEQPSVRLHIIKGFHNLHLAHQASSIHIKEMNDYVLHRINLHWSEFVSLWALFGVFAFVQCLYRPVPFIFCRPLYYGF